MVRGWVVWAMWRRVMFIAPVLSASIELGQLAGSLLAGYSYRVTEIDDVILNVSGVPLGFVGCPSRRAAARPGPVEPPLRSHRAAPRAPGRSWPRRTARRRRPVPKRRSGGGAAWPFGVTGVGRRGG